MTEIRFEWGSITADVMGNGINIWVGEDHVFVLDRKEALALAKAIEAMAQKRK